MSGNGLIGEDPSPRGERLDVGQDLSLSNGRLVANGNVALSGSAISTIGITNANDGIRIANAYGADRPETAEQPEEDSIARKPGKIRDINIEGLNFGYVVKIGCQSFAVETPEKLCTKLLLYMKNPDVVERQWFRGDFNLNDETETRE